MGNVVQITEKGQLHLSLSPFYLPARTDVNVSLSIRDQGSNWSSYDYLCVCLYMSISDCLKSPCNFVFRSDISRENCLRQCAESYPGRPNGQCIVVLSWTDQLMRTKCLSLWTAGGVGGGCGSLSISYRALM